MKRYFANPISGDVQSEEEWKAEYVDNPEWGAWEDHELEEVEYLQDPASGRVMLENEWLDVLHSCELEKWGGLTCRQVFDTLVPVVEDENGKWIVR